MIFSRNVLTVMTGTVFGQLIPVLASPFLARLYNGEQFGILALYMSISSLFVLIACGRYELAIVLPAEKEKALSLVGLSLLITIITSIGSFLLMLLLGDHFSAWFKEAALKFYLLFVPVSVLSMGIYQTFYNWALRAKRFREISSRRIIISIVTVAASIGLSFSSYGIHGLVIGFIAGQLAGALFISIFVLPKEKVEWGQIQFSGMKEMALHYKDFPRVNTAHVLLDSLQNYGLTFLLSFYFGNVVLGWYSFSYRVLRAPLAFVGAAFSQVLYQEMSEMKNKGISFRPLVIQSVKKIMIIGLPFFITLALFAPFLFKIVFGKEWENAGMIAQLMVPWLLINLACSPVSQVPNVLNRQKKAFLINLAGVIFAFAVFLIAIHFDHSIRIPFFSLSLASAAYLFFFTYWIIKISDLKST